MDAKNVPSNSVLIVEAVVGWGRIAHAWVVIDAGGCESEIAIFYTTTAEGGILGISNTCA